MSNKRFTCNEIRSRDLSQVRLLVRLTLIIQLEAIEHDYISILKFQTYKQCQVGEHWFDTPEALGSNLTGGNFFHRAFVTQKCQHYQLCVLLAVYVCPRGMLMCDINLWLRENLIIPCESAQGHKGSEQIIPSRVHASTRTRVGTAKNHQGDLSLFDISNCKRAM